MDLSYTATLEIAGVALALEVSGLDAGQLAFLTSKYRPFEVVVRPSETIELCIRHDPHRPLPAEREDARVWTEGGMLHFRHRTFEACFNPAQARLEAHARASLTHATENVLRLLVSDQLLQREGMLLHAAAIAHAGQAMLFCGQSEAGKTTLARKAGAHAVFSDEMPAVLRAPATGTARVFATPFFGEMGRGELSGHAELAAVCLLAGKHREDAHIMKPAAALQALLAVAFCYAVDPSARARTIAWCEGLVRDFPVIALHSGKDEPVDHIVERVSKAVTSG